MTKELGDEGRNTFGPGDVVVVGRDAKHSWVDWEKKSVSAHKVGQDQMWVPDHELQITVSGVPVECQVQLLDLSTGRASRRTVWRVCVTRE